MTSTYLSPSSNPFAPSTGHSLDWSNVSVTIKHKGKDKKILSNLAGSIKPKELCCILGHSGAGKTTLLKVLAGNLVTSGGVSVTKKIKIDGLLSDIESIDVKRKIAFVAQRDSLLPTATPREAIRFSARLRLPRSFDDNQVSALTETIISELGLVSVADSIIGGDESQRGLSGGEMRRVSLGVELVVRPSIVFLDEVSSGLDSCNAAKVIEVCKHVADSGAAVVLVVHQPNSRSFSLMDRILFMRAGECMYQGSGQDLPRYFEARGFKIPLSYNPSDWIMEVSKDHNDATLRKMGFFRNFPDATTDEEQATKIQSSQSLIVGQGLMRVQRLSVIEEAQIQVLRDAANYKRDVPSLAIRFLVIVGGSAIIAICLAGVGKDSVNNVASFTAHVGAIFFVTSLTLILIQLALLDVGEQHPRFFREFMTDHYSIFSYGISKMITETCVAFVQAFLFVVITFWSLDFNGRFWYWLLGIFLFGIVSVALGMFAAGFFRDPNKVRELAPIIVLPQMLLSGFIISPEAIPAWIRWMQWVCPYTYIFRIMLAEEFSECLDFTPDESNAVNCLQSLLSAVAADGGLLDLSLLYNDTSTLTLAQAGQYTGQRSITEYQDFFSRDVDADASLWNQCMLPDTAFVSLNSASDTECDITVGDIMQAQLSLTRLKDELVDNSWINAVAGQRLKYSYGDNLASVVVTEHFLYYPAGFVEAVVTASDAAKLANYICQIMANNCPDVWEFNNFANFDECVYKMEGLPDATSNERGLNSFDGNSTICRNLHASLASADDHHCPHISFLPMPDHEGVTKCTGVGDNISPSDLFDDADMALFKHTAASYGLNVSDEYITALPDEARQACGATADGSRYARAIEGSYVLPETYACATYLKAQRATGEQNVQYWMTLVGMFVFFRLAAFYLLRRKTIRRVATNEYRCCSKMKKIWNGQDSSSDNEDAI